MTMRRQPLPAASTDTMSRCDCVAEGWSYSKRSKLSTNGLGGDQLAIFQKPASGPKQLPVSPSYASGRQRPIR